MLEQLSDDAMLPHNRDRAAHLLRRKRQVLLGTVLAGFGVALFAPIGVVGWSGMSLLIVGAAAMLAIEVKRVLIFREDLRERRSAPP